LIPLTLRALFAASLAALLTSSAHAQQRFVPNPPIRIEPLRTAPAAQTSSRSAAITPDVQSVAPDAPLKSLLVDVLLADVGYSNGFRFSNLGGRREIYIPVPQGIELKLAELVLVFDDVSAHEARRSLEILANDRSVSAIVLDGKSTGRKVRIALANATARDGFLKLTFLYSGAATQDRCIDVRYVGDSLTMRPESAVGFEIGVAGAPNITATAALLPQNVAILLSNPQLPPTDIATALTLARSLTATGRQVTFYHGVETLPELVQQDDRRRWTRGLIVVGAFDRIAGRLDAPVATLASAGGVAPIDNTLAAARIGGVPVLLVTDAASARAGRLLGNPSLAALRDTPAASVGQVTPPKGPTDRVSFDELGVVPAQADVFGRADLSVAIASRTLASGTRPSRLVLDVMVAPDSAGEKAVVSAFVNERLLASTVAAIGEPTRLDFPLPDGLVGTVANIRVVVQRRSAQGDCRFEPQGYPAEILGSSSVMLSTAGSVAEDFSDLATLWANGVEVLVPKSTAARPLMVVGLLADVLNALSNESAPIVVKFVEADVAPTPNAPFIAVSNVPPAGATQRVRFDRGRVVVADRAGRTRLDIGGLATGAVAQIVTSGTYSGLWIKPLTRDGSLAVSPAVYLNRGDVAFLDKTGVALALSTERDTLLRISYPDQGSWLTFGERFRPWIVGGLWALVTIVLLFVLQRLYRRRRVTVTRE
jgi:cellulose synthase operon protein B